jgi:hypothetical protein
MSNSKHPLSGHEPDPLPADDLKDDPGIGRSKGTTITGEDPHILAGENTEEGDVANDVTPTGRVDPDQRGRTNP